MPESTVAISPTFRGRSPHWRARRDRALVAGTLASLVATTAGLAQPAAIGPELQVNTYTTGNQIWADVAAASSGDFVVVWHSAGSPGGDSSYDSVQGRFYAAGGTSPGAQFQVNS
jgi:hypothetical protein